MLPVSAESPKPDGLEDISKFLRESIINPLIDQSIEPHETSNKKMAMLQVEPKDIAPRVKEYEWIHYPKGTSEVNYLKDFLALHKTHKLCRKSLDLDEAPKESKPGKEARQSLLAERAGIKENGDSLGKRNPPSFLHTPNNGAGTKKLMDVASSIEERLVKYGRLSEDTSVIKRKVHNNNDFYEQDDFIDDPDDPNLPASMDIPSSIFIDYFSLIGNPDSLQKHKKYLDRLGEVKSRNRETKTKRNEESKKKREEMMKTSIKRMSEKEKLQKSGQASGSSGSKVQPILPSSIKIEEPDKTPENTELKDRKEKIDAQGQAPTTSEMDVEIVASNPEKFAKPKSKSKKEKPTVKKEKPTASNIEAEQTTIAPPLPPSEPIPN